MDDTFIHFGLKGRGYYDESIEFMMKHKRKPRLAFVFDRPMTLVPISPQQGKYGWPPSQLDPKLQDPISVYVRSTMYVLDRFKVDDDFSITCYVDNQIDPAIAQIQKLTGVDPENPQLFIQLGNLYRKKSDYQSAIDSYQRSLSLDPHSAVVLNQLARLYTQQKKMDDAVAIMNKLIALKPDAPETYYNLACMHAMSGNREESLRALKRAIDLGFSDCNLLKTDHDLVNIRKTSQFMQIITGRCRQ